jgi:hypothetical protein
MKMFNVYGNFMIIYALMAVNNKKGVWYKTPYSLEIIYGLSSIPSTVLSSCCWYMSEYLSTFHTKLSIKLHNITSQKTEFPKKGRSSRCQLFTEYSSDVFSLRIIIQSPSFKMKWLFQE